MLCLLPRKAPGPGPHLDHSRQSLWGVLALAPGSQRHVTRCPSGLSLWVLIVPKPLRAPTGSENTTLNSVLLTSEASWLPRHFIINLLLYLSSASWHSLIVWTLIPLFLTPQPLGFYLYSCISSVISVGFGEDNSGSFSHVGLEDTYSAFRIVSRHYIARSGIVGSEQEYF